MKSAYVAGRSSDVKNVRFAQQICRDAGYSITFDWTDPEEGEIRPDLDEKDLVITDKLVGNHSHPFDGSWRTTILHKPTRTVAVAEEPTKLRCRDAAMKDMRKQLGGWQAAPERARALAEHERRAIIDASVVVGIYKDGHGLGKLIEIGMAMALFKPVILVGPFAESVFWFLHDVNRVPDWDGLRELL